MNTESRGHGGTKRSADCPILISTVAYYALLGLLAVSPAVLR